MAFYNLANLNYSNLFHLFLQTVFLAILFSYVIINSYMSVGLWVRVYILSFISTSCRGWFRLLSSVHLNLTKDFQPGPSHNLSLTVVKVQLHFQFWLSWRPNSRLSLSPVLSSLLFPWLPVTLSPKCLQTYCSIFSPLFSTYWSFDHSVTCHTLNLNFIPDSPLIVWKKKCYFICHSSFAMVYTPALNNLSRTWCRNKAKTVGYAWLIHGG